MEQVKLNNRLTLNLGLRHDIRLPHREVLDLVSFLAGFREYLCFGETVVLPKYRVAV